MARPRGFTLYAPAFRALLATKGLTQKDVADRSGKSIQTISGLYRQEQRASAPVAQAIAQAMGVEAEALFPQMSGHWLVMDGFSAPLPSDVEAWREEHGLASRQPQDLAAAS